MPRRIEFQGKVHEFPDAATEDQIRDALMLERMKPPENPGKDPGAFLKYAAPVIPEALSVIGGFAAGPAGAGLGSVIGSGLQNEFPDTFGKGPESVTGLLTRTGIDTALGGGIPKLGAVPKIGKGIIGELKNTKLPHYTELIPWGLAGEASGVGWRKGLEAGIVARYGPAFYKGAKKGLSEYNRPVLDRGDPEWKGGPEPDIQTPPEMQSTQTIATPSGRVPGSIARQNAEPLNIEADTRATPNWKGLPESPTSTPDNPINTGEIPEGPSADFIKSIQQKFRLAKKRIPSADEVLYKTKMSQAQAIKEAMMRIRDGQL